MKGTRSSSQDWNEMYNDPLTEKAYREGYDVGFVHGVVSAMASVCILWAVSSFARLMIG